MRMLRRNRQKMYYAVFDEKFPVYQTDDYGDVVYRTIGGQQVPVLLEYKAGYTEPVEFKADIQNSGGEAEANAYGVGVADYDAVLYCMKSDYPFTETTLIWYQNTPTYNDDGTVDEKSADYRIARVPPGLNQTTYLLKRIEEGQA